MDGLSLLESRRSRSARQRFRIRTLLRALAGVVGLLVVGYVVFGWWTTLRPPEVDTETRSATERPVQVQGPRASLGASWMSRERGIWELHLEGAPYQMGFSHARLGARLIRAAEDSMFGDLERLVPSRLARLGLRVVVRWRYRSLDALIPDEHRLEIAGMAAALEEDGDPYGSVFPAYHRLVLYHALHDVAQGVERSPLIGCSALAVARTATSNGHLLIGRNFDFEGPEVFDRDKAVLFFKPAGRIPFASVAWAGMGGVVTGINAEGLYASINAARTDDHGGDGLPVELLVREILEQARSINEAVALLRKTPVMVPDLYLLADGKTGESAVVERSPTRTEVRRTGVARDTTLLTNHALSQAFVADAENDRLRRYLTSGARYKRLTELLHRWHGSIDPRRVLEILRDKRGPGGEPLGLGNRNALDALIATHGVIVDATDMTLWVSAGPHLVGRFVGFDLRRELLGEDRPPVADLPADPLDDSDELRAYEVAAATYRHAAALAHAGHRERAIEEAERAAQLSERMPEPHRLLGDLYRRRGDGASARREYERFLALHPASLREAEEVRSILSGL